MKKRIQNNASISEINGIYDHVPSIDITIDRYFTLLPIWQNNFTELDSVWSEKRKII